jgi:integrase
MAKGQWIGKWPGGRVWLGSDGRKSYVIRRRVGGRQREVATHCSTERAAMKQLERFEADPEGYDPSGGSRDPIYLDLDLGRAYVGWCKRPEEEGGKGNGRQWAGRKKNLLDWWMQQLAGQDLRRLTLDRLVAILEPDDAGGVPGRVVSYPHKVEVIKDFFGFLRTKKRLLTKAEDPTLDLQVPQARPGQRSKRIKHFDQETHLAVLKHITAPWSDMLVVLAGTGWHVTELARFIRGGKTERLPKAMDPASGASGVLVCPMHKSGDEHRTAVGPEVLDAAKRLRARGTFSSIRLYRAIESACTAAEVPQIDPGQYRHAVAHWALEAGALLPAISAFLGHKSPATTRKFYARFGVVPKVPTLA